MAPLAGLPENALAPLWAKVGAFVFRHGESFYNFRGLRAYKEKLRPRWAPRYLAVQGGWGLPATLRALTDLVNGGLTNVMSRR
jgi:phosphatidylglycerol lysyltransferase